MAVNIKAVAAAAGVSVGTVSNALNRPERVAASTLERVSAAITDLGFVRHESARQLRAGSSRLVAMVVPDVANPFFTDVARAATEHLELVGLRTVLCDTAGDPRRESAYLALLVEQRVAGVLLTPQGRTPATHLPVVLVDRSGRGAPSVSVDDERGARLAARHVLDLGHRRLGFVGGEASVPQIRERLRGARAEASAAGREIRHVPSELTIAGGLDAGRRLLAGPPRFRPTAILAGNDLVATGLALAARELDIDIPRQLALVGYDDIELAALGPVPLTTIRQPRRRIGEAAAHLLLEAARSGRVRHERLAPDLVVRASTSGGR